MLNPKFLFPVKFNLQALEDEYGIIKALKYVKKYEKYTKFKLKVRIYRTKHEASVEIYFEHEDPDVVIYDYDTVGPISLEDSKEFDEFETFD